jgi:threonylcarbamoyladenosine tRNA methylthiotransferase MtaB
VGTKVRLKVMTGRESRGVDQGVTTEARRYAPRVAFATFGCKLNQWETQVLERQVASRFSIVDFDSDADVYVINTCTVTGGSDAQARQLVRRTIRRRPRAKVVVTGCYAERAADELSSIDGVALVAGNGDKSRLGRLLCETFTEALARPASREASGPMKGRSRAHVAVQRGCARRCAYCIVPSVRGPGRSFTPAQVAGQVESLLEEGYREIVLTGTYLGDYGADLSGSLNLAGLVRFLNSLVQGLARLRISSLSPLDVTADLVDAVASGQSVCRHFHIAFQSADDGVLEAMNRGYDGRGVREALRLLTDTFPDCGLGGDAMVGFPGEGSRAFEETVGLVEEFPFSYLHVFTFSRRPGTAAATYGAAVPSKVGRDRSLRLRALAQRKASDFARRFAGRRVEVIAEGPSAWPTRMEGTSEEYLRVHFTGGSGLKGRLLPVDVDGVLSGREVLGRVQVH